MRVVDLFGGIGGFRKGLEEASDKYKFVWYCDNDKYAVKVYNKNFGEKYEATDIRKVETKDIPEFDMLCGGFPCQAFSIAGHRKGFEDTRGTLFFEIARIIKTKKPKIILLENVKGLLNHKQGETFRIILQALVELGYSVEWMVLNSKFHGVPQNRERVFIIGHLAGERRRQILPFGEDAGEVSKILEGKTYKSHRANEIREHNGSPTLTQNMGTGGHNVPLVMNTQKRDINRPAIRKRIEAGLKPNAGSGTIGKEDEAYCLDAGNNQGVARVLDANMWKGVTPKYYFEKKKRNVVAVTERRTEEAKKIRKEHREKTGEDWSPRRAKELTPRDDDKANCVTANPTKEGLIAKYDKLRRLTPIECERLQGFPDDWTKYGHPEIPKHNKCAKRDVIVVIINNDKVVGIGFNDCLTPQKECPRSDYKTGEGYHLCEEVCNQTNHAEVNACKQAGNRAKGGTMYLVGHYYVCEHCKKIAKEYGIREIRIGVLPLIKISDTQRYRQLGNAVTVNVIKALGERLI